MSGFDEDPAMVIERDAKIRARVGAAMVAPDPAQALEAMARGDHGDGREPSRAVLSRAVPGLDSHSDGAAAERGDVVAHEGEAVSDPVCIEQDRLDGLLFCGFQWKSGDVQAGEWRENPEVIQRATCERCLLRVFMLGDSATIALKRMGLQVEVKNAPEEVVVS